MQYALTIHHNQGGEGRNVRTPKKIRWVSNLGDIFQAVSTKSKKFLLNKSSLAYATPGSLSQMFKSQEIVN